MAFYANDQISSIVWQCLIGGAFLVGKVDPETDTFCGKEIIYLYPDLTTAIFGRFVDGQLISGHMCQLTDAVLDPNTFMLSLSVSEDKVGPRIKRDISTNTKISHFPLIPDLWESQYVEVRTSGQDEAGQGLYTKIEIGQNQVLALFNGVRCQSSRNNQDDKTSDQSYDYRIRLNGDTDIDIPPLYTSLDNYCATLGHKANHSFIPNAK
jgi:histone-lysine N-methyltransferase SETD7